MLPGAGGQDEKILILGNNNAIFCQSVGPYFAVVSLPLSTIQHMNSIMPFGAQPTGKRGGQLIVHQEFHAAMAKIV